MSHFKNYAAYYDLVYKDKDYLKESRYLSGRINNYLRKKAQTLLNIGCGTGKHDFTLKKLMPQLSIVGIDLSAEMIKIAQKNNPFKEIQFKVGDARKFKLNKKFDVVTSLFHVVSYLTQNQDIDETLKNINRHLKKGGLFIFDVWYGPAVLTQKPEKRTKKIIDNHFSIVRKAVPEHLEQENVINVFYDINIHDKKNHKSYKIKEKHPMRYFSLPEIKYILNQNGFTLIKYEESFTKKPLSHNTWSACFICIKK